MYSVSGIVRDFSPPFFFFFFFFFFFLVWFVSTSSFFFSFFFCLSRIHMHLRELFSVPAPLILFLHFPPPLHLDLLSQNILFSC